VSRKWEDLNLFLTIEKNSAISSIEIEFDCSSLRGKKVSLSLNIKKKIRFINIRQINSALIEVNDCVDTMIIANSVDALLLSRVGHENNIINNLYIKKKATSNSNTIILNLDQVYIKNIHLEINPDCVILSYMRILLETHLKHLVIHVDGIEYYCICKSSKCANPTGCCNTIQMIEKIFGKISNYIKLQSVQMVCRYTQKSLEIDFKTQMYNRGYRKNVL
jgi:hypothetical protein